MIDRWELVYALRLPVPTVLLNEWTRMHFRTKKRYMEKLGWMVIAANRGKPQTPLHTCRIHVERGNPKPFPDLDGLIGGLKPLLDVLVCPRLRNPHGLGFIKDDSQDFLKELTAQSVQTKPHEGYTLVKIYRETAMKVAA
jgi:hypothetical protein